jgi:hypothetical protein
VTIPLTEPGRLHHASSNGAVVIPAKQAWGGVWYQSEIGTLTKQCLYCDYFEPVPKTEDHTVTVRDPASGLPHSVTFKVVPASITRIGFGDTPGNAQNPITINSYPGQNLTVWIIFDAPPAPTDWNSQNAWLDVLYGGPSDSSRKSVTVRGPTNPAIQEQVCDQLQGPSIPIAPTGCGWSFRPDLRVFSFPVNIGACSQAESPNGCQATITVSSNQAQGRQVGIINVVPQ